MRTRKLNEGELVQGRYRIQYELGAGGFARVYLAEQTNLGNRPVAVKVMSLGHMPVEQQSEAARQFREEARLLARLDHPGIVHVYDFFNEGNEFYLVMEYVAGQTLEKYLLRQGGRLSEAEALDITAQIAGVLHHLHQQRDPTSGESRPVIYRDLKPANVMIRADGTVKLLDFGIARFFKPGQTSDTQRFGTPGYAAPEQYGHGQTDARSDVYSLGVLLHQMISGYDPAAAPMNLPPLSTLAPQSSQRVSAAVQQATSVDADSRFLGMPGFAGALGISLPSTAALGGGRRDPLDDTWVLPGHDGSQMKSRRPIYAGIGILLVAALFSILVFGDLLPPGKPTPEPAGGDTTAATQEVADGGPGEPAETVDSAGTALAEETENKTTTVTPVTPSPTPSPTPFPTPTLTPAPEALAAFDARPIVFDSDEIGDDMNIYSMAWNGSGLQQLTASSARQREPDLSPDGQWIAFEQAIGNAWHIYSMRSDGSRQQRLATGREPDWSPDGRFIAYESPYPEDVWIMNADGSGQQRLIGTPARDRAPSWSPDGARIVYMTEVSGVWQLFVADVNTGISTQITQGGTDKRFPVWSPDGALIAYNTLTFDDLPDHIWTVEPDGANPTRITDAGQNGRPAWSPDGTYIAFNSNRSGPWLIWRVGRDGSDPQPVNATAVGQRPDWGAR